MPVSYTHLDVYKRQVKVDKNYGTYSQYQIPNSTVLPIEFIFEDSSGIKFIGKNEELGNIKTVYDPVFEEKVVKITDSATFTQIIELDKPILSLIGYASGNVCDDRACTPFDYDFTFAIPGTTPLPNSNDGASAIPSSDEEKATINQVIPSLQLSYSNVKSECSTEEKQISTSYLWTFLFGFLGGLLALLTPCVFPLIPLTVSYFTKSSKDRATGIRNGILYGLSIVFIYVAIGLLITSLFGATALNDLSTNCLLYTSTKLVIA